MDKKSLIKIFILCLVLIIILLIVVGCDYEKIEEKNNEITENANISVESVQEFKNLDYNNLSEKEKNYIKELYYNSVVFTDDGVKVYNERVSSGMLIKTITSTWPENEISSIVPKPEYGKLDRIEYSNNWLNIYINDAKKSDAKNYLKELKEYNFKINETKDDGDVMLKYEIYDENGNFVKIIYMKEYKTLEICVKKAEN